MRTILLLATLALVTSCTVDVVQSGPQALPRVSTAPQASPQPSTGIRVSPPPSPPGIPAYDDSATTTVIMDVLHGGNVVCPGSAELGIQGNGDWAATGTPYGCHSQARTAKGHLSPEQLGALLRAAVTPSTGSTAFMSLPERSDGVAIGDVGGEIVTVTLKSGSHTVQGNNAPPEFKAFRTKVASATVDIYALEQSPAATATP